LSLVSKEFLLLERNLSCDHGLSTTLLLAGKFPLLKSQGAGLEFIPLPKGFKGCLLVESGLGVDDKR